METELLKGTLTLLAAFFGSWIGTAFEVRRERAKELRVEKRKQLGRVETWLEKAMQMAIAYKLAIGKQMAQPERRGQGKNLQREPVDLVADDVHRTRGMYEKLYKDAQWIAIQAGLFDRELRSYIVKIFKSAAHINGSGSSVLASDVSKLIARIREATKKLNSIRSKV